MTTEHATRKVLMSPELMDEWATRDVEGNRLIWTWREPGPNGLWEPTVTVDHTDNLVTAERVERTLRRMGLHWGDEFYGPEARKFVDEWAAETERTR